MNIDKKLREELKDKFKWYGGKDDYGVLYDNDVDYTFQSILKAIMKKLNILMDNKRIKALENNFVMYSRGWDDRHCPMCGAEPRRQKKMIFLVIKEILK